MTWSFFSVLVAVPEAIYGSSNSDMRCADFSSYTNGILLLLSGVPQEYDQRIDMEYFFLWKWLFHTEY